MGTGASSNTYKQAICTTALADLSSGWHHFVGTYDGFNVKIYIDGVLDGTLNAYTAKTPIFYNTANTIFIGAEAENTKIKPAVSNPYYFNGKMSDVRIYAKALSANDIEELYKTSAYICDSNVMKGYEFSEVGLMPYEYKQIEYLENTGNNFITTNYIPNSNNLVIKTKFYLSGYSTTVAWIAWFTGYSGEQNNTFRVIRFNTTNNSVYVNHNSKANNGGTQVSISGLNTLYDITLSHGKININGTETNISTTSGNENTSPFTLFANGGVSTPTSFTYGRFYYFSVYDGNNPVLNLVPVRVGNVGYMYDTVNKKLFGNSGSGSFVLGPDKVYNEIEYLESSGTQRIDTNIVGGKNTAIEIKFYVTSIGSSYEGIFGSRVTSNNTNSISLFTQNTSNVNQRFGSQVLATQIKINTLYTIYLDKTKITINGTTTNWNQTADFTTPGTLTLFGIDSFTKSKCKIYYTKIWEDEELVLDLIPVRVDDIGYMYNRVTKELYENSGTGNFILGQDIYQDVNIYKNGLIECNDFTETSGSTTFGDSYVLSEEFVEI